MKRLIAVILLFQASVFVSGANEEERLLKDLLAGSPYRRFTRPVLDYQTAVDVSLGLMVMQLRPFPNDEPALHSTIWPQLMWTDQRMQWNAADYGDITQIRVPPETIWLPDLAAYNSLEESALKSNVNHDVVVYSTGAVSWIPQANFKTLCEISTDEYGRMERNQTCTIKFGSWTFDGLKLNLKPSASEVDLSEYSPNNCWTLRASSMEKHEKFYDCCPEPYLDITVYFQLQKEEHCK